MSSPTTKKVKKCHCGKNGHALNSINCPVHKPIKAWMIVGDDGQPLECKGNHNTQLYIFKGKRGKWNGKNLSGQTCKQVLITDL